VLLGATGVSPQYGILGDVAGRKVAIDLNQTHTISLFGVQGGGKSYTLGTIIEMACLPIPRINRLPSPLAAVIFHYSSTQDYKPEFTSMIEGNADGGQMQALSQHYGAGPHPLTDVVLLRRGTRSRHDVPNTLALKCSRSSSARANSRPATGVS
jgi:DNA phosphorothioation-dependent restriction protein DptH